MRLVELSLRNYRVFEELDLELPARVIGIFGENGAGKSSLLESIAFCLYGIDAARTKKKEIRTHGVLTDCEVRLVFEHGGQEYEARRSLSGRGHAPDAQLYGGGLLLASGVSEVDAEVQRLLHMDLRVFRASVYAEQKQLDAFSDLTAGRRKEMALRLLGIRPVDDARKTARADARATKQGADQLAGAVGDIAALEASLKEAKDAAAEARAGRRDAAAALREAEARAKAARKRFDQADAARQRVEKLTVAIEAATAERDRLEADLRERAARIERLAADLEQLPDVERELASLDGVDERLGLAERLAEAAAKLAAAYERLASLPAEDAEAALAALQEATETLAAAREAAARADGDRARAGDALTVAEERLARAADADPAEPCPTCGQRLGEGFAAYVEHCEAEARRARELAAEAEAVERRAAAARKRAEARLAKAESAGRAARERSERRARLEEQASALRDEVAELAAPFEGEAPDLDALRAGRARARELAGRVAELGVERKRLAEAEADAAKLAARLEEAGTRLATLTSQAEGLSFDADEHARLAAERVDAERAVEAAREAERRAADAFAEADRALGELSGRLAEARATEARVGELRSEGRYLERTAMLLDGFRDHLVARVGPELSREAEALFRELTNHAYDDLRIDEETLAIHIADGDTYFPVERFSGSEGDLANLALRVAISTHLSRVSGADLGVMVLDEVLGSLDDERRDLMVRTMGRLAERFHQLFVITHAEHVKDQFPASILVTKVDRRRSTAQLV